MILDASLKLVDSLANTLCAASTNIIDTVAAGDSYEGAWFYVNIVTLPTQVLGTNFLQFQLQTSAATNFGAADTLVQSSTLTVATCATGYVWRTRIPPLAKRYLRGYLVNSKDGGDVSGDGDDTNTISGLGYSMSIVKDVDMNQSGVLA